MATILITGASVGIGRATALEFARAGHTVYATMRTLERGRALAEVVAAERLPIHLRVLDVDADASVAGCFDALRAEGVVVDLLINNAGIEVHGSIEELPLERFRAVMETNYFGALRCIKQVVGPMRERGSGCIINVTSVAGRLVSSPLGGYAASKHALEAVSEALAMELLPFGVRVLVIEPGIIDTAMPHAITEAPPSHYRQVRQLATRFRLALEQPTPPSVVAVAMRQAYESGTSVLRHPAGPDAAGLLAWRAGMSDTEWIEANAIDDETFVARLKEQFGKDVTLA